jgi:UDP-3-O-[3-hydroxymyristoyl] glucosamine N-acyltransferase
MHTVASICEALRGRLTGDGTLPVRAVVQLADAGRPDELALAMEKQDVALLGRSAASIAVVADGASVPEGRLAAYIEVRRPRHALMTLTRLFDRPYHRWPGRHPSAVVDPTAVIGENVSIGALACIGPGAVVGRNTVVMSQVTIGAEAVIGEDCLFHPGAQIGERVRIGHRVILHMNASVGADGFSFVTAQPGAVETAKASGQVGGSTARIQRVNSIGTVVLNDDVEIGACATVDRATIAATVIGRGTKIDNLVMIAHNCTVGENCMMSGQAGVAGSTQIGNRVVIAGKVGVADHLRVGDDSVLAAKSGVVRNLGPKSVVFGAPAQPHDQAFAQLRTEARMSRYLARVDDLQRRVQALERK